jgi:endonuclease/exonuclease/phosphatase (EEP) superfamily protein YafD
MMISQPSQQASIVNLLGRAPSNQDENVKRETFAINLRNSKRRDIINSKRLAYT